MFSREIFGERLRLLRKERGERQEDLGNILGVTKTQISDMEKGKVATTMERFALICEYYNVSADYLLGRTDDPRPPERESPSLDN